MELVTYPFGKTFSLTKEDSSILLVPGTYSPLATSKYIITTGWELYFKQFRTQTIYHWDKEGNKNQLVWKASVFHIFTYRSTWNVVRTPRQLLIGKI